MTRGHLEDERSPELELSGMTDGAQVSLTENLDTLMEQSSANCSPEMKRFLNAVAKSLGDIDAEASGRSLSDSKETMFGNYRK